MTAFTSLDRGSKAPPGNPLPPTPCPCPATSLCPSRCSSRKDSLWIALGGRGAGELKSLGCNLYMELWGHRQGMGGWSRFWAQVCAGPFRAGWACVAVVLGPL